MAIKSVLAYDVMPGWEQLPPGHSHPDVAAVDVDSSGRVYLFCRGDHPVMVYERDGAFVGSWGEGRFTLRAHGLTVAPDDTIWCTDDADHTVRKFTRTGDLLLTLGVSGRPSETGYDGHVVTSITKGGPPFNRPTNLAVAPSGDLYVADGYGNARVHRFSERGELIRSWGEPGDGPGQFMVPHGIRVHRGRVFVCDRENDRIQIFSPDGEFLEQWRNVQRPTQIVFDADGHAFVSHLPRRAGATSYGRAIDANLPGTVSVLDEHGSVMLRLGDHGSIDPTWGLADPCAAGNFCAPHGVALDPNGDLYVSEVTWSIGGSTGLVPATCHTIQKFSRTH